MRFKTIMLVVCLAVATTALAADDTPSFKVGSVIFADYTNQPSAHLTSFNVSRAYLNITGQLNHWITFRVTPDIARETGSGSSLSGSQEYRLKYAFGQFNLDDWTTKGSWVRFGMQQTPFLDYEENVYRYRFQGQVFAEREGYLSSSDSGLSGHYNLPKGSGDIHAGFYNGEGYSKAETNTHKDFEARATLKKHGIGVTAFVDAATAKRRVLGQLTYEGAHVRAGADLLRTTDKTISGHGWSVWATPRLTSTWELLLRHDEMTPDRNASQKRERNIAGVAYWFPGLQKVSSAILADYDSLTQSNYAPARKKDTRYGLKMLVSF